MKLIDQHTKKIMEGCKERALDAGLSFDKDTLEYFVTNTDMIELAPKNMIPTLYDFWINDIQVLKGKGEYDLYPNNPYETVINTRPAISFYNDNNPDWLNVMIFYHVIGHIDFFQNNLYFSQTWEYDLKEKALTDKRLVARLRSLKGRTVDYVLEFARSIDNLVGYYDNFTSHDGELNFGVSAIMEFYFNQFLQEELSVGMKEFLDEVERYNNIQASTDEEKDELFLKKVRQRHTEFDSLYKKFSEKEKVNNRDLMQFIMDESEFLNKKANKWMKSIVEVVRGTSLYFSPQIRTKIMNEGWASYWHEKLFLADDRIKGNEVAFAKINAKVTSLSKVGLNPYAVGWRLFMYIEELVDKGKYSHEFRQMLDRKDREDFDKKLNTGRDFIFKIRENFNDFTFVNSFIDQDFIDKYNLMVVGQRINEQKNVKEYYIKSRKAEDYREMVKDTLYHPPNISFERKDNGELYLTHQFEEKELFKDYIPNTLIGIEYLWGYPVSLETSEIDWEKMQKQYNNATVQKMQIEDFEPIYRKVKYKVKDRKVIKEILK